MIETKKTYLVFSGTVPLMQLFNRDRRIMHWWSEVKPVENVDVIYEQPPISFQDSSRVKDSCYENSAAIIY